MITVAKKEYSDEPLFLLLRDGNIIPEVYRFLRELESRMMAPTTIRAYAYDLLSLYRFLEKARISIPDLTREHGMEYLRAQRAALSSPGTINRRLTVIRQFLNGNKEHLGDTLFEIHSGGFYKGRRNNALLGPLRIKKPATQTMRLKVPRTLRMPLQTGTIRYFIEQLRFYRDRAIVTLMLCSGLRSCEVIRMMLSDIDLEEKHIRVRGKGRKERLVPLSSWVNLAVERYLACERPDSSSCHCFLVLKGPHRGLPMTPEGLRSVFRYRRRSGLFKEAAPHQFRHTFCTNLIRQKVPLPVVQKLMGHADIHTTMQYTHLSLDDVSREYHQAMGTIEKHHEKK